MAATMAVATPIYPIIHDKEKELNLSLTLLTRINLISEPNEETRICDGCHKAGPDLEPADPED